MTQKQQETYYQTIPGSSASLLLPQPDDTKIIQEEQMDSPNPDERQGRPIMEVGATRLWQAGSVPNADYTDWSPLQIITYIGNSLGNTGRYTNDGNPILMAFGGGGDQVQSAKKLSEKSVWRLIHQDSRANIGQKLPIWRPVLWV